FSYVTLVYFWIDWQAAGILFVPLSITLSSIVLVGNLLGPVTGGYLKVVAWTLLLTTAHSAGASVVNFFRPGDHLLESAGHGLVAFILLLIAGPLAAFAFSRNND
ncbi:MAG TPA: hypothetical protein VK171_07065, partial [Fimbriimonas sp.]|nr:hypothetical protein [Fimbriimonas sp.]